VCQASKKLGASDKKSSLSRYVTLRTKPCLENRRRRPIALDSLKNAKADLSTKEDSPKAKLRFSCQDGDSRWKASTSSKAPQGEVQADSSLALSCEGASFFNQ
jgi:hypothetical protein